MNTRVHILITALLFTFVGAAQTDDRLKELADRYFDEYSYDRAIKFYEELNDKPVDVRRNLAESYLKTNRPAQAEVELYEVVNSTESIAEDLFNYSQVLAMNKKYPESVKWMTLYHEQKSGDSRAIKKVQQPEYYVEIQAEASKFEVTNLDINSADEDFGPAFYKDKVVFASSRTGIETVVRRWNWNQLAFLDMYVAERDSSYKLSSPKRHHKKFNKKFHEGPATFNKEGDVMIYTSNNYKKRSSKGEVNLELYETRFDGEKWTRPESLPYNDKEYSVGHASLTADGNTMYFVSDMPGGYGGADIYRASRNSDGSWGEPELLDAQINTEGNEMFPFIQKDSILFFASDGHLGIGGLDIFYIDFRKSGVYRAKNIKLPVNSNWDDFAFIMNDDRTKGYFSSNREGGKGDDDIYMFTLPKPMAFNKMLKGRVINEEGEIIPNAKVILKQNDMIVGEMKVGENGEYEFEVDQDLKYTLSGSKERFSKGTSVIDLENVPVDVVHSDLMLTLGIDRVASETPPYDIYADYVHLSDDGLYINDFEEDLEGMSIYTLVKDVTTDRPIPGAKITIRDLKTGEISTIIMPETGDHTRTMDPEKKYDRGEYEITIEKAGYRDYTFNYFPELDVNGQYRAIASMIPEDYKGSTLVKETFELEPIYFDLNKYNIRPDAAAELDKVVALMNEMPDMIIELSSHTDCRASKRYNDQLSHNRAVATAKYIRKRIDDPSRIYGDGAGELELVNDCACEGQYISDCSEEEHQKNRRTEFRIVKL